MRFAFYCLAMMGLILVSGVLGFYIQPELERRTEASEDAYKIVYNVMRIFPKTKKNLKQKIQKGYLTNGDVSTILNDVSWKNEVIDVAGN